MTVDLNPKWIKYVPMERVTTLPHDGFWDIRSDRWWVYQPDKGLVFYRKSPQCNINETIARKLQQQCWPDAELIFLERVYLPHDCGDYV
jgi:hypothetical protein